MAWRLFGDKASTSHHDDVGRSAYTGVLQRKTEDISFPYQDDGFGF